VDIDSKKAGSFKTSSLPDFPMVYMKKSKILVFSPGNMSVNFPSILFTINRLNQLLFSLMNEWSKHTEINNISLFSGYPAKLSEPHIHLKYSIYQTLNRKLNILCKEAGIGEKIDAHTCEGIKISLAQKSRNDYVYM
jgi:hypothetical protein